MATTSAHDPKEESSAMAAAAAAAADSLKAELEAAVKAWNDHVTAMNPPRKQYDELFFKHKQLQARYEQVIEKISSNKTPFAQHKRYFGRLSNALLASNINLRSSPRPITDLQTLTHATLFHNFKDAAHTLNNMVFETKRLETIKMMFWKLDQKLSERSTVLYQTVIDDGKKLDRLHVEVLAVKKRMGKKPDCGVEEGKCVSCARTKKAVEREAKEKEAEEKAAKETEAKANKKGNKRTGTGSKTKWGLENIVEEDDMNDWANLQF